MKKLLPIALIAFALAFTPSRAHAQFGFSVVYDPTNCPNFAASITAGTVTPFTTISPTHCIFSTASWPTTPWNSTRKRIRSISS